MRFLRCILALFLSLFILSCGPDHINTELENTATLTLELETGEMNPRIFLPEIDMEVAYYKVKGLLIFIPDKPPTDEFEETFEVGEPMMVENLAWGEWIIEVMAYNEEEELIGKGCTTVFLGRDCVTDVTVKVMPLMGLGVFNLDVMWPHDDTLMPYLEGELTPARRQTPIYRCGGEPDEPVFHELTPLRFRMGAGRARAAERLFSGYYAVTVRLYDQCCSPEQPKELCNECEKDKTLLFGGAEILRIVKGEATHGTFEFEEINRMAVGMNLYVDLEMADPLEVAIDPMFEEMFLGEEKVLSASTSNAEGAGVVYSWYRNGVFLGHGEELTLEGEALGVYRLDLLAFTADGKRAGSASFTYHVVPQILER